MGIGIAQRNGMTKAQRGCVRLYNKILKNIEWLQGLDLDNELVEYLLPFAYSRLEQLHNGIIRHAEAAND